MGLKTCSNEGCILSFVVDLSVFSRAFFFLLSDRAQQQVLEAEVTSNLTREDYFFVHGGLQAPSLWI